MTAFIELQRNFAAPERAPNWPFVLSDHDLATNLRALWVPFATSAGPLLDIAHFSKSQTLNNAPPRLGMPAHSHLGLDFDGHSASNHYTSLATNPITHFADDFTAMVDFVGRSGTEGSAAGLINVGYNNSTGTAGGWTVRLSGTGPAYVVSISDGVGFAGPTSSAVQQPAVGVRQQLIVRYNRTDDELTFSRDGGIVQETVTGISRKVSVSTRDMEIGRNSPVARYFPMQLIQAGLWRGQLADSQVAELFKGWPLYAEIGRISYFFVPAAAPGGGRIMSSLANAGGLAGMGGIAGQGGGLAA